MTVQIRQNHVHSINKRIFYFPFNKNWIENFMKRHSQFKAIYIHRIETSRIEQSTEERCKNWLDAIFEVLWEHNISASNVYIWMKLILMLKWQKLNVLLLIFDRTLITKSNSNVKNDWLWSSVYVSMRVQYLLWLHLKTKRSLLIKFFNVWRIIEGSSVQIKDESAMNSKQIDYDAALNQLHERKQIWNLEFLF